MKTMMFREFNSMRSNLAFMGLIAITSSGCFPITAQADLNDGLVAYYPFNGNANDESGNGNNGTVNGATLTTDRFGKANSAYSFNGSNNYIEVPNSSSLQSPTTAITMAVWIYVEKWYKNWASTFVKSNNSTFGQYGIGSIYDDGSLNMRLGGSNIGSLNSSNDLTKLNKWNFVVATWDGNKMKFYVNDQFIDSVSYSKTLTPDNMPLEIGMDTPGETEYLYGKLDDIRIYNRALTASEITQLYNEGKSYTLALTKNGSGKGNVTSDPAGIDCGATCSAAFDQGSSITLTANPEIGSTFAGWVGACSGAGTCKVTLDADKSVTATFKVASYTLSISKAGNGTITSTDNKINCGTGSGCSANYPSGTAVTLNAAPDDGYQFDGWSGACGGAQPICTFTISANSNVTATFTSKFPESLTITKAGSTGEGQVSSNPAGIDCGPTCFANFPRGIPITLTAVPGTDATFGGWSGACVGNDLTCTFTLDTSKIVNALFKAKPKQKLTINLDGNGTVTSDPPGIRCGTTCVAEFTVGTPVTLTAAAKNPVNFKFTGWTGDCIGSALTCQVTLDRNREVDAHFARIKSFWLHVKKSGAGTITSDPVGIDCGAACLSTYPEDTVVTLTATPQDILHQFGGWGGDCLQATGTTCTLTMNKAQLVSARFTAIPAYQLTIKRGGPGTVTSADDPVTINCGTKCKAIYPRGTQVILIPTWNTQMAVFKGWSGGGCSGTGACVVTTSTPLIVTATFARKP